ncbi:uncharacterized protein [Panulirus ornatus]|uniref:uncharacterized protein isoform X1 n=1 Tax=Panulirus ornatus TaxID=150431 RepID=UPI003A8A2DCD
MSEFQWCCIPLRASVLLIGIIDMLLDSLQLLMVAYRGLEASVPSNSGAHGAKLVPEDGSQEQWLVALQVGHVMVCVVDFLMAVILLRGVHKKVMNMVMVWWWWTLMQMMVHFIFAIVLIVKQEYIRGYVIATIFFMYALFTYFLVVVRSYAISLKKKKSVSAIYIQERQEML